MDALRCDLKKSMGPDGEKRRERMEDFDSLTSYYSSFP